jgi:isopentenyl-diphosphate delta-isomerase
MTRTLPTARGISPLDEVEFVTLVDAGDQAQGPCGKIEAHRAGKLHRAFSILITNPDGELLLQRRAAGKYHFAGRWSNACCGHPRPGEETLAAARRRLAEELGVVVPLGRVAELRYRAVDPTSGLIEHEYLHVLWGQCVAELRPNPNEVSAVRWMSSNAVQRALARRPEHFTPWFRMLMAQRYVFPPDRPLEVETWPIEHGEERPRLVRSGESSSGLLG